MGDITCPLCGEPWDYDGARYQGDMTSGELKRFLAGEGCPACSKGKNEEVFNEELMIKFLEERQYHIDG